MQMRRGTGHTVFQAKRPSEGRAERGRESGQEPRWRGHGQWGAWRVSSLPTLRFAPSFVLIEVSLIYNVVLESGVRPSDSVIYIYIHTYIHTHILFHIFFHYSS